MPEILIVYEHKAREYQCITMLKAELEKRGHSVKICHYNFGGRWFHQIFSKPKLVIGPGAHYHEILPKSGMNYVDWATDSIRGRAPFYLNLQIEQVFRDGPTAIWNVMNDDQYRDHIYYTCWGNRRYQQIKQFGVTDDKICIAGAIQLDLLKDSSINFYKQKEEVALKYGLDKSQRWNLFISGFMWSNKTKDEMLREARAQRVSGIKVDDSEVLRDWNISIESQKIVLQWIERYLEDSQDIFIYRPHPGEKVAQAVWNLHNKFPEKFFIIDAESVQQWISVCDVINLWTSTAIVETYMANKTCNIVQPLPLSKRMVPILFDYATNIVDTYGRFVESQRRKPEDFPIEKSIIDDYYTPDKEAAYKKTCDFIESILKRKVPKTEKSKFTWKTVFDKTYLQWRYAEFYMATNVRLSKLLFIKRRGLANTENAFNNSYVMTEIKFSNAEKENIKKIRDIIKRK